MNRGLTFLFFLLLEVPVACAGETLHLGTALDAPLSQSGRSGMVDAIVREAFSRIGIAVNIERLPAERSLINADRGINDGDLLRVGGLSRLYPRLVQVPEKIMDMEFVGFTRNPSIRIDGWESLAPFSVGIITGWKILEDNIRSAVLTKVENRDLLFRLLARGRVEIVVYERREGGRMVAGMAIPGAVALEPPLATREMFLYLNEKHRVLVPRVAESLRGMKGDGTYDRMVDAAMRSPTERMEPWAE